MMEPGSFAERTARPTVQARDSVVLGWLTACLEPLARAFESSPPRVRTQALEIAAVLAILAVGAVLRFWGLGAVGLHGDEKTMALPTMHLVQYGTALFPSGMHYVRGIGQLYFMAAAVHAFGRSAWSFRLPSALCGILLIALAYLAGRRYLGTAWNLAFTAAVACLPSFIEDAQTARMYVFLVTCVAGYVVLLFQWERTGRDAWLAAAAIVLMIGIQFHQLAIFAAFLLFYPGLVRADARRLLAGLTAFIAVTISFFLISHWIDLSYPQTVTLPGTPEVVHGPQAAALISHPGLAWLAVLAVILAGLGASLARALPRGGLGAAAAALLALAPLAQLLDAYHVACIVGVAGLVAAGRAARGATRFIPRLALLALACAAILAVQLFELAHDGVPLRERIGLLLGWPSVWPFFAIAEYSRITALAVAAGVALAIVRLARRQVIPEFVLFLALGVWIPLLMIGLFEWNIPPRYAAAQIFPLLLGGFAAAQWLWQSARRARSRTPHASGPNPALEQRSPRGAVRVQAAVAALFAILAVGPVSFARAVGSGYGEHPDHLGAARFMLSRHLGPKDIVIAEDVIVQTYYLGHVDDWLIGKATASKDFVYRHDDRYEDIYTNTPLITTASELERLIARRDRGAIYIIGSGEQQTDGRAYARGPSLEHFFRTSPRLHVVFVGRDGLTKVWEIAPPGTVPAPARIPAPASAL
ncbi:MAG: ArnT family glycosyltransferase [Steroidobacteraceae bacterium]